VYVPGPVDVVVQQQRDAVFRGYQVGQCVTVKPGRINVVKLVNAIDGMPYLSGLNFNVSAGPD
jgi:hypothetical protein